MKKWLTWSIAGLMLVLLAGCAAGPVTGCAAGPLGSSGVPKGKYLIGISKDIDFKAPQDGYIYVVEGRSGGLTKQIEWLAANADFNLHEQDFVRKYYFVPATAFPYGKTNNKEETPK